MRTALIGLLAFAAGVLLMLALGHPQQRAAPLPTAAPKAASMAGASSPGGPSDDGSDDDGLDHWPAQAPTPEQVIYAQPASVQRALAALTPRVSGRPNLYMLAFAGDGSESVFRNEADYAAKLFAQRFGARGHTIVLENYPDTLSSHPLATWSNLEAALDGLARRMHTDEDILVLYLTSHGSEDRTLYVDMDPLPLDQLDAEGLGQVLSSRPFKWKVVVVNACYSGGFIPSLRGPGTLVVTAARADRSSFGCGSDADITYFGRAWLVDALNQSTDFEQAFHLASKEVGSWESRDGLTPSQPQIDIGTGITQQLARWHRNLRPAPALAFHPAASTSR